MDYDNDGIQDFISGSYDPGDVYLFRGLGKGKYADVEKILDENRLPLAHHPEQFARYTKYVASKEKKNSADSNEATQWRVASFGSWPATVDWDNDGDLDILIGSFAGNLFLRENKGTRSMPIYDAKSVQIKAGGENLKVRGHNNPVVVDWDSDGLWDLVVGSSDGSVVWFKNVGKTGVPKFAPHQELVAAAAEMKFLEQNLGPDDSPKPGVRAQICVTDYNQDGKLDLIVGDYSNINWTKNLSDEEQKKFQNLKDELTEKAAKLETLQKTVYGEEFEALNEADQKKRKKKYRTFVSEFMELDEKKKDFYKESRSASFIWLYLRK